MAGQPDLTQQHKQWPCIKSNQPDFKIASSWLNVSAGWSCPTTRISSLCGFRLPKMTLTADLEHVSKIFWPRARPKSPVPRIDTTRGLISNLTDSSSSATTLVPLRKCWGFESICRKARVRKDILLSQKSLFKCRAFFKSFKITPCIQSYLFSRNVSRIMEIYRTQIRDFLARRCEEISRSQNQKKWVT